MKYFSQRLWIGAAVLLALVGLVWLAFTQGPLAAPKVELATVRQGDLHPAVFGIGTIEARFAYALGPTQAGRVKTVSVDQGDRVVRTRVCDYSPLSAPNSTGILT